MDGSARRRARRTPTASFNHRRRRFALRRSPPRSVDPRVIHSGIACSRASRGIVLAVVSANRHALPFRCGSSASSVAPSIGIPAAASIRTAAAWPSAAACSSGPCALLWARPRQGACGSPACPRPPPPAPARGAAPVPTPSAARAVEAFPRPSLRLVLPPARAACRPGSSGDGAHGLPSGSHLPDPPAVQRSSTSPRVPLRTSSIDAWGARPLRARRRCASFSARVSVAPGSAPLASTISRK